MSVVTENTKLRMDIVSFDGSSETHKWFGKKTISEWRIMIIRISDDALIFDQRLNEMDLGMAGINQKINEAIRADIYAR